MSNIEVEMAIAGQAVVERGGADQGRFFEVRFADEATLVISKHLAASDFEAFPRSAGDHWTAKLLVVIQRCAHRRGHAWR